MVVSVTSSAIFRLPALSSEIEVRMCEIFWRAQGFVVGFGVRCGLRSRCGLVWGFVMSFGRPYIFWVEVALVGVTRGCHSLSSSLSLVGVPCMILGLCIGG